MPDGLRERYLAYLEVLNQRRFDELSDHVAAHLVYNERSMTRTQYEELLRGDVRAIPDLRFSPDLLVVEGSRVACRLSFDCLPEHPFLGFPPPGRRVRFAEHVFYEFVDGRIVRVHSLIDRDAIREQIGVEPDS